MNNICQNLACASESSTGCDVDLALSTHVERMDTFTNFNSLHGAMQIAIFVLPVMVLVGWAIGKPFLLDLEPFAALVLTLSVIHTYFVSSDGNSNWYVWMLRQSPGTAPFS